MTKQTVLDQERIVDKMGDNLDMIIGAIGAVDYMLGNRSTWSEYLFDEDINYDGVCRMIGAVKVPHKIKVGSADDLKSYLLNEHRILADQLSMEKDKLLRLMRAERNHMVCHYRDQYDDAACRQEGFEPQSLAWHRLQAIMETYKHLMFKANEPIDQ